MSTLRTTNILRMLLTLIKGIGNQPTGAKSTIINSGRGSVVSSAYTGFKHIAKAYGFYQDVKPYLPETYIDKYRYKPHKRVAGQIQKSKGFLRTKRNYKQYQKRGRCNGFDWNNSSKCGNRQGYKFTTFYG